MFAGWFQPFLQVCHLRTHVFESSELGYSTAFEVLAAASNFVAAAPAPVPSVPCVASVRLFGSPYWTSSS